MIHGESNVAEQDKSYTKDVLGNKQHSDGEHKILGVKWSFVQDTFDLNELSNVMTKLKATKWKIVSITANRLYDCLSFMLPVIIRIKVFYQELRMHKVGWDEPLIGQLLNKWNSLISGFLGIVTSIPRCYFWSATEAAVVHLKVDTANWSSRNFVACKIRVAPLSKQTIQRLELLSTQLLTNLLINTLNLALTASVTCYIDLKVFLYRIQGLTKEWSQHNQKADTT